MEKGLYSISMIRNLFFDKTRQMLYFTQYDPYDNLVEIEFSIENVTKNGFFARLHRYYTQGEIHLIAANQYHVFEIKDYQYIHKNSQFL